MSRADGSKAKESVRKKPAPLASQLSAKRIIKSKTAEVASGPAIPPHHVPAANDEAIRHRAYLKWLDAGMPESDGVNFWLEAERDLQQGT